MARTLTLPDIEQALRIQKHQASLSPPANTFRNARATHTDSMRVKRVTTTPRKGKHGEIAGGQLACLLFSQRKAELPGLQNAALHMHDL